MPASLFAEHRAIATAADELLAATRATPRIRIAQFASMRAGLSRRVKDHLLSEEEKLIGPLRAIDGFAALPAGPLVLEEVRKLRGHYSEHIRTWTLAAIEADWDGYVVALAAIIDRLKDVLAREEAEFYVPALDLLGSAVPAAGLRALAARARQPAPPVRRPRVGHRSAGR